MINALRQGEWETEDELEAETMARRSARFTIWLNLSSYGFRASEQFLDDWIKRSAAGQIGTSFNFRKRFCEANHFEVDIQHRGKTLTVRVAEMWGLPFAYILSGPKPLLLRIMPRGWHLSQAGRSVRTPRFCRVKP